MSTILSVQHISKHFGGIKALNNCSLYVEKGKVTALIGPNGSGKTTLFNVISQLLDEDEGKIVFEGERITDHNSRTAHKVANLGISRTFQQVRLFKHLTIKQHLELAMGESNTNFWHNLIKPKSDVTEKRIREALAIVELDKDINTVASELSYGQRKLLDLAIAIAKPHKLLMLDEPVAGVNPKIRATIKEALKKLRKEGETILLIEHDMTFTMDLADTIYVLDAGTVIANGKPNQIRKNPAVLEAYLGN